MSHQRLLKLSISRHVLTDWLFCVRNEFTGEENSRNEEQRKETNDRRKTKKKKKTNNCARIVFDRNCQGKNEERKKRNRKKLARNKTRVRVTSTASLEKRGPVNNVGWLDVWEDEREKSRGVKDRRWRSSGVARRVTIFFFVQVDNGANHDEYRVNPGKWEKERMCVCVSVSVCVCVSRGRELGGSEIHERMNGSTKVARTYQPDIVGLIGGVQVQGNIVRPIDRVTPSRTHPDQHRGYRRRRGPASFSQSRASVTYLVGLRHRGSQLALKTNTSDWPRILGYTIFRFFFFFVLFFLSFFLSFFLLLRSLFLFLSQWTILVAFVPSLSVSPEKNIHRLFSLFSACKSRERPRVHVRSLNGKREKCKTRSQVERDELRREEIGSWRTTKKLPYIVLLLYSKLVRRLSVQII